MAQAGCADQPARQRLEGNCGQPGEGGEEQCGEAPARLLPGKTNYAIKWSMGV